MTTEYVNEWIDAEKAVVTSAIVDGEYTGARVAARRIQRKRTRGWRMPEGAVYVGRPTRFGNPFHSTDRRPVRPSDQLRWVENFRTWLTDRRLSPWFGSLADEARDRLLSALPSLRGRDLACWCPLDQPCHADVLLELANR